jgi:hypothetical protein
VFLVERPRRAIAGPQWLPWDPVSIFVSTSPWQYRNGRGRAGSVIRETAGRTRSLARKPTCHGLKLSAVATRDGLQDGLLVHAASA